MCGICGFISRREVDRESLKKMSNCMIHRGPNDSGEEIYSLNNGFSLGLAHRRLSIIDLSYSGHQPMHSADKRISLVFNGEIYNYIELKEELNEYNFQSDSDTEVLIASYLKWGIDCVSHFNGMFAFALFDRENETLYLVRDRIGKKPLFYWLENENIVFASSLKAIESFPHFEKNINKEALGKYIYHQYIVSPNSIFDNVYKVEPGVIIEYKYGKLNKFTYWNVLQSYYKAEKLPISYNEAKKELRRLLYDSVNKRMIADVPFGAFLSGGYDSSLITAIAQDISKEQVRTFSIGFEEDQYNEAKYASMVAKCLGTNHTDMYVTENDMLMLVDELTKFYDEPFADSSQLPSMLVAKMAKDDVTVVLSGDGGDELFCGYNLYSILKSAQKIEKIGNAIYHICNFLGAEKLNIVDRLPYKIRAVVDNQDERFKTQMGGQNYVKCVSDIMDMSSTFLYDETRIEENNWQIKRMLLDQMTYLPDDILCKIDRATMAYSLEARCPLLDFRIVEYSYMIPHEYKYANGDKKHILKDLTYDFLPKELMERPKKGFSAPIDKWLRKSRLKDMLLDYSSIEYLKKQDLFNPVATNEWVKNYLVEGDSGALSGANYSKLIWSFLVFQMWKEANC